MRIATGKSLSAMLRAMAHDVRRRLWISSPYVGGWTATKCLIDIAWRENPKVDVRLLTDIENDCLNPETIEKFHACGMIKHLRGLHAKTFIIDDQALVTSANLTRMAFTQRCELGVFLSKAEAAAVIRIFGDWWDNEATSVPAGWCTKLRNSSKRASDEPNAGGNPLKLKFPLPQAPDEGVSGGFGDYNAFRKHYENLAHSYSRIQRLWPRVPLYLETDAFLNYLFHHAPGKPSQPYRRKAPQKITSSQRLAKIKHHAAAFAQEVRVSSDGGGRADRLRRSQTVHKLLRESHINELTSSKVRQVLDCFHCLHKRSFYKARFAKNKLGKVRKAWWRVLHGNHEALETAMHDCVKSLDAFGRSSVQELLGWYDPKAYPIRNSNSNAGLRYFGYQVRGQ